MPKCRLKLDNVYSVLNNIAQYYAGERDNVPIVQDHKEQPKDYCSKRNKATEAFAKHHRSRGAILCLGNSFLPWR